MDSPWSCSSPLSESKLWASEHKYIFKVGLIYIMQENLQCCNEYISVKRSVNLRLQLKDTDVSDARQKSDTSVDPPIFHTRCKH